MQNLLPGVAFPASTAARVVTLVQTHRGGVPGVSASPATANPLLGQFLPPFDEFILKLIIVVMVEEVSISGSLSQGLEELGQTRIHLLVNLYEQQQLLAVG